MKLPNYPHRSTVTESSSLIVLISVSQMVQAMTSHARRWLQIVLPKPWAFRRSFMAKTEVSGGGVGQKWKLVTWGVEPSRWCNLILARLTAIKMGWAAFFQASIAGVLAAFRWRWQRGYDRRRSNLKSVPSSVGEVAGIGGWSRVKVAGFRVESGSKSGQLSFSLSRARAPLSFLFWKPAPPFPFIETSFFFKRLLLIKLMPDPCWNKIQLHGHWIVFELSQFYVMTNLKLISKGKN